MAALNEFVSVSGRHASEEWDGFRKVALAMRADLNLKFDPQVDAFSKELFSQPVKEVGDTKI